MKPGLTRYQRNKARERLRILADMLENHDKYFPTTKLWMPGWGNVKANENCDYLPSELQKRVGRRVVKCTSAACAFGSACLFPPFNRRGLRAQPKALTSWNSIEPEYVDGKGTSHLNWVAATEFFGLSSQEAFYLFDGGSYYYTADGEPLIDRESDITADMVAKRVYELLAEKPGQERHRD